MHDGYIFILGIGGTASASSPATTLLDTMLAALPPVKRAALLGEVVPLDNAGHWHDPLIDPVLGDMADAEVLLVVTPLPAGLLPARLAALLERATPLVQAGRLAGKYAALLGVSTAPNASAPGMARLEQFCVSAGILVVGSLLVPGDVLPDHTAQAVELAQLTYHQARQHHPDALPRV